MLKSLYEGYFQKSNVFLFPILGISKGSSVTPVGIYTSLKGHYTHDDYKLITTYYLRDDPEFNVFEKTRLLGNKYFYDYLETSKDVGELCDKPSLRKETLEITLKNLEKDGLSLNSQ